LLLVDCSCDRGVGGLFKASALEHVKEPLENLAPWYRQRNFIIFV
jgi:hypothetical protein